MARSTGGGGHSGGSRGGGGRSMGGGSRSVSRSFSGSGRTRTTGSSGSGGHRNIGGGGGYHPPHSSGPSHYGGGYHHGPDYHHHHGGPGYPPPPRHHYRRNNYYTNNYYGGGGGYGRSSGCGCSSILTMLILLMIIGIIISFAGSRTGGFGSNKKLNRDKFNGRVDSSHGYYMDMSEKEPFIDRTNENTLISGFKEFYNKTGVFPFLYIVEHKPSPSEYAGYDTYQDKIYEQLFKEEGNFLIVYIADEDDYYYAAGYDTGTIIDDESLNLISAKINSYWSSGDLAKAMGNGLRDASKNIMAKSNFRVIMIALIIGVVVVIIVKILFKWWQKSVAQKNKEQEDLERTLSTPLETFGTTTDDLAKKYDDNSSN